MQDPAMATALALLLDFCKAYDSVDRAFMYEVLLWLGFPVEFVKAMRGLHDGTRVRFLANGYRSRWVAVTCGIRQGRPLAPILFILVLEALYRRIDDDQRLTGIVLKSKAGVVRLKVGGYADDTASYVRTAAEVWIVMDITRIFASASGLTLNEAKTLVIALNPASISGMGLLPVPLKLQAVDMLARYLGLQVGSVPDPNYTWQVARTQLVARLALATRKTLTVDQRSIIAMAIVIPKLLFIGRHQWPTTDTIKVFQTMIKNFVWHGRFTNGVVGGRAWLNNNVAMLPRQQGGLAIPDLKVELHALAAVTVNVWAVEADPDTQIVGDVLIDQRADLEAMQAYVTPRHTPPTRHSTRVTSSAWTTGLKICNTHGGVTPSAHKAAMVVALFCTTHFRGSIVTKWYGRRLVLNTEALKGPLSRSYVAAESALHGTFCPEWLPYMALAELTLYAETGAIVHVSKKLRTLCRVGSLVKDIMHWKWLANGGMLVTVLHTKVTKTILRQTEYFMLLLLLNFPQLLQPGDHSGQIRYTTTTPDSASLPLAVGPGRQLIMGSTVPEAVLKVETVNTHRELIEATQRKAGVGVLVKFVHPHPRISRLVCLWKNERRWTVPRKTYKNLLRQKTVA
ncbi:hypothetical protein PR003_g27329, partial [Phytophthora rubi]